MSNRTRKELHELHVKEFLIKVPPCSIKLFKVLILCYNQCIYMIQQSCSFIHAAYSIIKYDITAKYTRKISSILSIFLFLLYPDDCIGISHVLLYQSRQDHIEQKIRFLSEGILPPVHTFCMKLTQFKGLCIDTLLYIRSNLYKITIFRIIVCNSYT